MILRGRPQDPVKVFGAQPCKRLTNPKRPSFQLTIEEKVNSSHKNAFLALKFGNIH
jgi:hypothetical protein